MTNTLQITISLLVRGGDGCMNVAADLRHAQEGTKKNQIGRGMWGQGGVEGLDVSIFSKRGNKQLFIR